MRTRLQLLSAVLFSALVCVGLAVPAAEAATVPKVYGVKSAGQDWYNAKLKVRWTAVSRATYQLRWSRKTSTLPGSKLYASKTNYAYSPALSSRCVIWYVQVRAVRAGRVGPWSSAKGVRFTNLQPNAPVFTTAGQTSLSAAQVRWSYTPYVARYRLDWSAAPYAQWPGFEHNYTPWAPKTGRGASITLPASPASGDRFLNPRYGNPVFAQLQYDNGCSTPPRHTAYFPVFPKAAAPGDATTGDPVAFGSYNLELTPTLDEDPTKIANLADNIATANLDVVALQEASPESASDLADQLEAAEGQDDWAYVTGVAGQQQIMFRTGRYAEVDSGDIGMAADGVAGVSSNAAATPLPTPWARLAPVDPDPIHQDIVVVSVHLEDRLRFDLDATIPERKADASAAATVLLAGIEANAGDLPVLAAGDFKGNFGGNCDEKSIPFCNGEGQPTFIRGGFYDARGAVTKVGIQYGTVNKHVVAPPAATSGIGGRADFIVVKGFTGVSRYQNVNRTYGNADATQQSDHNLIFANLFVPRIP